MIILRTQNDHLTSDDGSDPNYLQFCARTKEKFKLFTCRVVIIEMLLLRILKGCNKSSKWHKSKLKNEKFIVSRVSYRLRTNAE